MADLLDWLWRTIATVFCLVCFGLGGVLLGAVVFPVMALVVRDPARRALVAKSVIHAAFRFLVALLARLGVLSYEIHGAGRLRRTGLLILANHPTLIDVVFLMSLVKRADCIVKSALANNPFTSGPVRAAGFIFNDAGAGLIDNCIHSVREGNNLIIFPEGTRTPPSGKLHLQRGAARVAIHGEVDITPIRIRCVPPTMGKGDKWYRVPRKRAHFRIEVGDTIHVARFISGGTEPALAARRLTEYLTDYFSTEPSCARS